MDDLVDSRPLTRDPAALRARLAADGYLFLRGLLPAARVGAAGERVARELLKGGWTEGSAGGPHPVPSTDLSGLPSRVRAWPWRPPGRSGGPSPRE